MPASNVEKRLQAIELELAELKKSLQGAPSPTDPWWEKVSGAFSGDPAYQEAMRLGRQWRQRENTRSLAPKSKRRKKPDVRP